MKRRLGHHEREAWIMAGTWLAMILVGIVAGLIVQYWPRHP